VAALGGPAMGGGAELATSTDFRVMSTKAKIQFVQSRMGVSCGWGGTSRLVKVREGGGMERKKTGREGMNEGQLGMMSISFFSSSLPYSSSRFIHISLIFPTYTAGRP